MRSVEMLCNLPEYYLDKVHSIPFHSIFYSNVSILQRRYFRNEIPQEYKISKHKMFNKSQEETHPIRIRLFFPFILDFTIV